MFSSSNILILQYSFGSGKVQPASKSLGADRPLMMAELGVLRMTVLVCFYQYQAPSICYSLGIVACGGKWWCSVLLGEIQTLFQGITWLTLQGAKWHLGALSSCFAFSPKSSPRTRPRWCKHLAAPFGRSLRPSSWCLPSARPRCAYKTGGPPNLPTTHGEKKRHADQFRYFSS